MKSMNNIKISVLLPVYNQEKNITKCILSVKSQTFKDYELIIINDGSTDKTENLIKAVMLDMTNIVYIKQTKKGLPSALNLGIK